MGLFGKSDKPNKKEGKGKAPVFTGDMEYSDSVKARSVKKPKKKE